MLESQFIKNCKEYTYVYYGQEVFVWDKEENKHYRCFITDCKSISKYVFLDRYNRTKDDEFIA